MSRQQMQAPYNRSRAQERGADRRAAYIEGNTVRRLEPMPQRRPRELEEREQRVTRQTRENRRRAMQMSPGYLLFLSLAVALAVGACALYVQVQSELNTRMRTVSALESQVLNLRADNDAAEKRIETSVNLEDIRNVAMEDLGMVYPEEDQIVYFSVEPGDYMNQYQDIPED